MVNDHWEIAIALECPWVHLGQEDLDDADVAMIKASGIRLGVSTHDMAELERACAAERMARWAARIRWHPSALGRANGSTRRMRWLRGMRA